MGQIHHGCARKHRSDGPEAYDALTIKPDHPMGAGQTNLNEH